MRSQRAGMRDANEIEVAADSCCSFFKTAAIVGAVSTATVVTLTSLALNL